MPRTTSTEEMLQIEAIVAGLAHGAGIATIEAELERLHGHKPNRRTLQRRLHKLVADWCARLTPVHVQVQQHLFFSIHATA
ncbi:MAG: hypothetical protein IPH35_06510 [Rhodoferax sp.]|nr:hypothetical protein [Rhodoferax sp.]